jgi:hypothetical protein
MFQGDMEQWVRFANTIKLRIAIRESNTTEIAAIYAEGSGFITDDVLVNPGYLKRCWETKPILEFIWFRRKWYSYINKQSNLCYRLYP